MDGFVSYMLMASWEELLVFLFLWGPLLVLAVLCVLTLDGLPPQRRRGLFALFFTMLALAALLFGGALGLWMYGLAWRTWFQVGLSMTLWLVGLVTGIATVGYGSRWLVERYAGTAGTVLACLSGLCLASVMLMGTLMGGLWAIGPSEQVVTYAGQRVILGQWGWGSGYELYEYHGPLVRGAGPMLVDWDWDLVEGAIIDAG